MAPRATTHDIVVIKGGITVTAAEVRAVGSLRARSCSTDRTELRHLGARQLDQPRSVLEMATITQQGVQHRNNSDHVTVGPKSRCILRYRYTYRYR